ncbi:MAG: hypothetical protein MMC33_010803 [Icmadophila ericetorum]|nr:hypothetical protein [Icmadophila ericetorum]
MAVEADKQARMVAWATASPPATKLMRCAGGAVAPEQPRPPPGCSEEQQAQQQQAAAGRYSKARPALPPAAGGQHPPAPVPASPAEDLWAHNRTSMQGLSQHMAMPQNT